MAVIPLIYALLLSVFVKDTILLIFMKAALICRQ